MGKIAAENENPDAIERLSGLLKYQDMQLPLKIQKPILKKIGFIVYSELSNNLSSETSRAFAICTRLITVILRSARSTIPI